MTTLNRFIINTDYDSLKIVDQAIWNISIPETSLEAGKSVTFSYDFSVSSGVFFEIQSVTNSLYDGLVLTGGGYAIFARDNLRLDIDVRKKNQSTYTAYIYLSSSINTTTPKIAITIKNNLLVPSEQQ